ncbi:MAG: TonB-dependent receptor domain-containing protein, partial [Bryobacteraceae bacterium]
VAWTNNKMATDAYTILDNVTKVVSNHTLKMGFMYRLEHAGQFQSGPTVLSFPGEGVADPTTGLGGGSGLAQFELGAAMNKFGDNYNAYSWNPYLSWPYWGFYLQDDFHITPRFTLNIGLRYDIFGAFRTRQHPDSRFCFSCPNPATGLPGQVQYEGQPGFPEGSAVAGSNYNDLGPRLNFAWSANGKTVVRGGYDIFYSNEYEAINSIQSFVNIPGWANNSYWTGSFDPSRCAAFSGQCVAWPLSSQTPKAPLATPPITLAFPAQQNSQVLGGYMQPTSKPSHDPMVQTWTLQIEHQLPDKMALTLGYTGTHGTHLLGGQYNYNHVPTAALLKYRASINSVVPITDFYSGLTAKALTQAFGTPDLPISTLTQRYPFWPFFVAGQTFDGTNIYHALNVRLKKQYSRGLQWNLTYTFSKNIVNPFAAWGSTSGFTVDPIHNYRQGFTGGMFGALGVDQPFSAPWQNYDNINEDRALAPYDIPQMLTITGTYELPFGSGRRFINHKGVLNGIIGGWQLTGMFNAQSGVPLTITGPCNGVTCRPNLVGDPTSFGGSRTKAQQIAQWFNPAAFAPVFGNDPAFWANPDVNSNSWWQFGTAGIDLPGARSPGFWNLDSSLLKDFHIGEEHYFQFRWEVFNTLNHQNLGLPNTRYCLPPGPNGQTNLVQQAGCTFGEITNVQTDPRAMEFALKFVW